MKKALNNIRNTIAAVMAAVVMCGGAAAITAAAQTNTVYAAATVTSAQEYSIAKYAPQADDNVKEAFTELGFKLIVDPTVNYSGYFEAKTRTITLMKMDDTVYHELGHFVMFAAGNADTATAGVAIYNAEKKLYTASNSAYVLQDAAEYFAESYRDYCLAPAALKKERPQTYAYIQKAVNKITAAQVKKIKAVYACIWA